MSKPLCFACNYSYNVSVNDNDYDDNDSDDYYSCHYIQIDYYIGHIDLLKAK